MSESRVKERANIMGVSGSPPEGPVKWRPRAITKNRDLDRSDFNRLKLESLVLKSTVSCEWEDLNEEIWVRKLVKLC